MPPELVALTDGPNILLDKPIMLLGRHQECDIQLGSRKVSRRHCCLAQVEDYFVVRDLGSTNGIRINDQRVTEGSLRPGDVLTIGNQRYELQWASHLEKARPKTAKPQAPPQTAQPGNLESCDIPVPLPDEAVMGPVAVSIPVATPPAMPLPRNGIAS